nr:immunoglobulin light chain junction region [Macaca mulatta]
DYYCKSYDSRLSGYIF